MNRHRLPRPGAARSNRRSGNPPDAPRGALRQRERHQLPVLDVDRPKRAGGKGANRRRIGQADGDTSDPERGGRKHSDKQSFHPRMSFHVSGSSAVDVYWLIGHGGVTTDLQYLDELISSYFGYHLPAHGHDRGGRCGRVMRRP